MRSSRSHNHENLIRVIETLLTGEITLQILLSFSIRLGFQQIYEERHALQLMLAIDILRWPGVNQAFVFSAVLTTLLSVVIIPIGKRRSFDRKATWGEAMLGSAYIFFVLFLAFGVVPHQWIDHADKNLGWRKDKLVFGPFDILKSDTVGGNFPITLSYEAIRDIVVVVIHVYYIGLMIYLFSWWQKRGEVVSKEVVTSSYGRPLVKKS